MIYFLPTESSICEEVRVLWYRYRSLGVPGYENQPWWWRAELKVSVDCVSVLPWSWHTYQILFNTCFLSIFLLYHQFMCKNYVCVFCWFSPLPIAIHWLLYYFCCDRFDLLLCYSWSLHSHFKRGNSYVCHWEVIWGISENCGFTWSLPWNFLSRDLFAVHRNTFDLMMYRSVSTFVGGRNLFIM